MRIFTLATAFGLVISSTMVNAQFSHLRIERVEHQNRVIGTTWRVYAVMQQEGDIIDAVYGDEKHPMQISSSAPFYQHKSGSSLASKVMRIELDRDPLLRFDSWFTIGAEDNYMNSVMVWVDTSIDEFDQFDSTGTAFYTRNNAWFVTPDKRQAMAPASKEILLMQLTSTGKIDGVINLHGRTRGVTDAAGVIRISQIQETGLRFTCDPEAR